VDRDETAAFSTHGHILLRGPGERAVAAAIGNVPENLYWIRCRLERSFYEQPPELDTVLINTASATQATTTSDEILGGSNGRPNQRFTLASTPIVPLAQTQKVTSASGKQIQIEYVRLEVSERPVIGVDLGFQVWEQVNDFAASGPDDPHFTLNRTTGEIAFGDGIHGRIPVANPANPNGNIVARLYRSGGGKSGNVGANTLTNLLTFIEHVEGVDNPFPASGGSDEESLEAAKARAPLELKSRGRAVTAEDFEYFALQTPGVRVRRALALPLVHPQFKGVTVPGAVTVIVVPDSDSPRPTPGSRTIKAVCACLNQVRLLTTEVFVIPPTYRKVKIAADIIAQPGADLAAVKTAVETSLGQYLHPLKGGDDGQGWPFGLTVFYSRIYQVILRSEGVDRIENNQLEIYLDDEAQPFCRDVEIDTGELVYSEEHDIRVSYGF
jgi:predicted phage baseplate assembly protein